MIWPLVLLVLGKFVRSTAARVAITLALAAASALAMGMSYHPGTVPNLVYYGTDTRAFALLIGAALAFVWPSAQLPAVSFAVRDAIAVLGFAGLALFVWMVLYTNEYQTFMYRGGMVILAGGTMFVVQSLTMPTSLLSAILGIKPLRWLGVRSYAIYLWHYPIIALSSPLLVRLHNNHLVCDCLVIVATVAVSALSWEFVEDPIRRIRRQPKRGQHRTMAV